MACGMAGLSVVADSLSAQGGHHINVNVFDRATLLHAMKHPEQHLTREQQLDIIDRTFHGAH